MSLYSQIISNNPLSLDGLITTNGSSSGDYLPLVGGTLTGPILYSSAGAFNQFVAPALQTVFSIIDTNGWLFMQFYTSAIAPSVPANGILAFPRGYLNQDVGYNNCIVATGDLSPANGTAGIFLKYETVSGVLTGTINCMIYGTGYKPMNINCMTAKFITGGVTSMLIQASQININVPVYAGQHLLSSTVSNPLQLYRTGANVGQGVGVEYYINGYRYGVSGITSSSAYGTWFADACKSDGSMPSDSGAKNSLIYGGWDVGVIISTDSTIIGTITAPTFNLTSAYGTNQIYSGTTDGYNPTGDNNMFIKAWWGLGFRANDNITRIAMNTRTGDGYYAGTLTTGALSTGIINASGAVNLSNPSIGWSDVTLNNYPSTGLRWNGTDLGYAIYRSIGAWTGPSYQQLVIAWNTGIILTTNNNSYARSFVAVTGSSTYGASDQNYIQYGPNATWGAYLIVGATHGDDKLKSNVAQVVVSNGNLHLDCATTSEMYLNYYSGRPVRIENGAKLYCQGNATFGTNAATGDGKVNICNPDGSYTHFGYPNNFNYIRGPTYINNGRLSIGDDYVMNAGLYISSYINTSWTLGTYIYYGGSAFHNTYGTWATSIWAVNAIVSNQWFGTSCDVRIKTNIQPVKPMLDIINQIEIVSFDFIDPTTHKRDECGVIAQQLEKVFPNAVDTTVGHVPNFMTKATYTVNEDDNLVIIFDSKGEVLKVGDRIKLIAGIYHEEKDKSTEHGGHVVDVLEVINGGFICAKWTHYVDTEIIVYGMEVPDFRNVDQPQLGILALKGVQELHAIIAKQQQQILAISKHMAEMTDQLNKLTLRDVSGL